MAYTNVWSSTAPLGSIPAGTLDDEIRKHRLDNQERMDDVIGLVDADNGWDKDPVIDGVDVLSLRGLKVLTDTKPTINTTDNFIPKRASAGAFSNSDIAEDVAGQVQVKTRFLTTVNQPRCKIRLAGTTPTLVAPIAVSFSNEIYDAQGMFAIGSPTRITIPVSGDGVYLFIAQLPSNGSSWVGQRFVFRKNGADDISAPYFGPTGSLFMTFTMTTIADLVAGDYVEIVFTNGTSFVLDSPQFMCVKVA